MRLSYPRTIYAIKHNVTGKVYIGSTSKPLKERYANHIGLLRKGKHHSKLLQKDFQTYGEDFTVYQIGTIDCYENRELEYQMMLKYDTVNPEHGYNQGDFKKRNKNNSIQMNLSSNNDDLVAYGE